MDLEEIHMCKQPCGSSEGKQIHKVSDYGLFSHIFIRLGHIVGNVYSVFDLENKKTYIYAWKVRNQPKTGNFPYFFRQK